MDSRRRNTHQFRFKLPKLKELMELGSLVSSPYDFKERYGRLLTVLNIDVEDGVLNTLVQFYDSAYRCFIFPDFQLAPTLEEYSYYIGFPVSYQISFSVLEKIPKSHVIWDSVHLRKKEIDVNLVTKGGILGLPAKFLIVKVANLASVGSMVAFKVVLAFPNVDNFVDINAIHIFLFRNPTPTLLAVMLFWKGFSFKKVLIVRD